MSYIGNKPTAVPLTSGDITNGIITTDKIADDAISAAKLASGVGGKVLQVVQDTKTDTFSSTTNSNVDITGLSVSITPASSSNKIFVTTSIMAAGSGSRALQCTLLRDSTVILQGDAASNRTRATFGSNPDLSDAQSVMQCVALNYLDSPSSTSSLTYKVQISSKDGGTVYVNRDVSDSDNDEKTRGASTITVMEVAG